MVDPVTATTAEKSLNKLHRKSRHNRAELANSTICGCFNCLNQYPFQRIAEWTENEETAICPCCGIDSVLGFSTPAADQQLLRNMHKRWFEGSKEMTSEEWDNALEANAWTRSKS